LISRGEKEKPMARPGENREDIKRALAGLGWEVRTDDEGSGAVMGAHDKYHLMVNFEGEKPTSVLISYVGRGGEIPAGTGRAQNACPPPKASYELFPGSRESRKTLLPIPHS
jgi:hypothetical protein